MTLGMGVRGRGEGRGGKVLQPIVATSCNAVAGPFFNLSVTGPEASSQVIVNKMPAEMDVKSVLPSLAAFAREAVAMKTRDA